MSGVTPVLALTEDMPERQLDAGEVLFDQGDPTRHLVAVLVRGSLTIQVDGAVVSDITLPGTFVGEMGALLDNSRSATVVANERSTVRLIGDPDAFFASHPELALELARQLAGRLHRLLAYLAQVRREHADSDGHLILLDRVISQLSLPPLPPHPTANKDRPN
jgi:CRP-like cAMP-binding protein